MTQIGGLSPRNWDLDAPQSSMVKLAMAIRQLILVLSTSVILCLVMFAAAWWYFGSAKASWAYFRGESLYVDEPHKVIQPVTAGELGTITFVLQNLKSRPITIHGINASCNCVMAESLPLKIEARDKHSFNFGSSPNRVGNFGPIFRFLAACR